ncbi:threonine aldolase family protein [Sneathiella glossodoripedis]|uniref:threonine aldolase family protein n=1 Tax=Sneathiella glossodoripedis TaxID=418853 RepID=UPI000AC29BD5|nr:low specificity L-threonine aldolase [Sneathiella glossodoripedis]
MTKINFASDNAAPVCPELMEALLEENAGPAMGYGNDPTTERMEENLKELFDQDLRVFPVATGTAANVLALSVMTPPWGSVYCHKLSHIEGNECGAPEFFTGGAKLVLLDGEDGKLQADRLQAALEKSGRGTVHHVQPAALSLTQVTESGTVYTPEEVQSLVKVAKSFDLSVHMDGARFANAIAALGCHPADVTGRAGVDVLSFGATKNGAMAVEAVVFFNQEKAQEFEFRRKRGAHLFSKSRYLSAQLDRYVQGGLWLKLAEHANRMATRLSTGLSRIKGCEPLFPVQANMLFCRFSADTIAALNDAGFLFYVMDQPQGKADWSRPGILRKQRWINCLISWRRPIRSMGQTKHVHRQGKQING